MDQHRQIEEYFQDVLDSFTDADQLSNFAEEKGLTEDIQVRNKINSLKAHDESRNITQDITQDITQTITNSDSENIARGDFQSMLQNFTLPSQLLNFAKRNNLLQDADLLKRMNELKTKQHCSICLKQFNDNNSKDLHESNCQGISYCYHCKEVYSSNLFHACLKTNQNIQKTVHLPTPKTYPCQICTKTFTQVHLRNKHQAKCKGLMTCGQCKKHFTSMLVFGSHKCSVKCQECNKIFPSFQCLTKHKCGQIIVRKYHSIKVNTPKINQKQEKEELHCGKCSKKYYRQSTLNAHLKSCQGNFTCGSCNKKYTNQLALDAHRCRMKCNNCKIVFNSLEAKNVHNCTPTLECGKCNRTFKTAKGLGKHICKIQKYKCTQCSLEFNNFSDCKEHTQSHHKNYRQPRSTFQCMTCKFESKKDLTKHICNINPAKRITCRRCFRQFDSRHSLNLHIREFHLERVQTGRGTQTFDNPQLEEFYELYKSFIFDKHELGQPQSFYNFPLNNNFSIEDLTSYVNEIYTDQSQTFKINLAFGCILQNITSNEYRYFKAYSNSPIFELPINISRREDIEKFRKRLSEMDVISHITQSRPNSKWKLILVTNVRYFVTSTSFPLGHGILPPYIKNMRCVIALIANKRQVAYSDKLCLFRCLTYHNHGSELYSKCDQFENKVQSYYKQFCDFSNSTFENGVELHLIPDFEKCFKVNINIFSLQEDKSALTVYKSMIRFADSMNLNLFEEHLSYIQDIKRFCFKYQCKHCEKHFKTSWNVKRHMTTCTLGTKYEFVGGFFDQYSNIFDELKEFGILLNEEEKFYNYFIVFDFESYLKPISHQNTSKTFTTTQHHPISVSICSNVPGYLEAHCIVDSNQEQLVQAMLQYMTLIQCSAHELIQEKWCHVFENLSGLINKWETRNDEKSTFNTTMVNKMKYILHKFEIYASQIPVLGFNSAKYDINLIKKDIARCLGLDQDESAFVIKKNNSYSCIANENFKFIDIINYLAPGTSYSKFLKAFKITEGKSFFPYEFLDDPDKLNYPELPPYEAFYSSLKNCNILGGPENYITMQNIWKANDMQKLECLLRFYNNLDCEPFCKAIIKLQDFYKTMKIDVFKSAISIPGVARQLVFKTAAESKAYFSLFDKNNSDLYFTFLSNIIGGPSIIFKRYAEAGKTKIRDGTETCKRIIGLDCNALYLYAFSQDFPVGSFIRRRQENKFIPERRDKYDLMFDWMDHVASERGIHISHKRNSSKEKRDSIYLADGFCAETNTIFQFDGCYFHGHYNCPISKKITSQEWKKKAPALLKNTQERDEYYLSLGYNIEQIWECEFIAEKEKSETLRNFITNRKPEFYRKYRKSVTHNEILHAVKSDLLFGALEVDLEVPKSWMGDFKPDISPEKYFEELCPIFCTTDIPFESIGEHMQNFAKENNISTKPRRLLVGGMKAKKILIATQLLRWYMSHGIVVTKIYQVIEYNRMKCFKNFVSDVTKARRSGDINPDLSIIADLFKLLGNSAYGSTIMNKLTHSKMKYVSSESEASILANETLFKTMTQLSPEYEFFELELQKDRIKLDLPIQIGYFILQIAKLRILEFYYDCIDKYIPRTSFELLESDTDSLYFAISGSTLTEVIKPELKLEFDLYLNGFCSQQPIDASTHWLPRTCCSTHAKFDSRTPGLFKVEYTGDTFIGLCSKTYIVQNSNDHKFSCKGISKNRVHNPMQIYRDVLENKKTQSSTNIGFISKDNSVFTYQQERAGFSYFYAKRVVLPDGISTKPLDLLLQPITSKFTRNPKEH